MMSNNQNLNVGQTVSNHQLFMSNSGKYGYNPLSDHSFTPNFLLKKCDDLKLSNSFNQSESISIQHYFSNLQPVVIFFYSGFEYGSKSANYFEELKLKVKNLGGNLIIITNKIYNHHSRGANESLQLFIDENNAIATSFGLYNPEKPIWTWLSGIEEDKMVIPAVYIISPYREIIFTHIDSAFSLYTKNALNQTIEKNLLQAVNDTYAKFN